MNLHAFLACLVVAAVPAAAHAATILVPADQPTIQAAVDAAQDGDTIVIAKGKYPGNVVISARNNLTIQANGKVTLQPSAVGMRIDGCTGIRVTGLAVVGGTTAFLVVSSQNVTIERFSVRSVSEDGIAATASSGVHVLDGKIRGCGSDGISFADSEPGLPVTASEIANVKVKDCENDGVDVLGADIVVSGCTATNVGDDGLESDDQSTGPVRFENCKAKGVGSDGFNLGAPGTTAVDCSSTASADDGFDIEGAGSRVERCTAKKSRSNGFQMEVTGATLLACSAAQSSKRGFELVSVTNSRLENCSAKKSGQAGFFLDANSSGNTLVSNEASASRTFDLDDESGGANTLQSNQFRTVDPN